MATAFKLTTWNVQWLNRSMDVATGRTPPGRRAGLSIPTMEGAEAKLAGVRKAVEDMAPDVLFLCEAIHDEAEMTEFVGRYLPGYVLVTRNGPDDPYEVRGQQGLWFVVRAPVADACLPQLLPVETWRAYAADASGGAHGPDGRWVVSAPVIEDGVVKANARRPHRHYRQPQVLRFQWEGAWVDIVGAHLKSKHVKRSLPRRAEGQSQEDYLRTEKVRLYLAAAHEARIKLTTEATDIRYYIDQRFAQEREPLIFVAGDLNDGPGKELLEREYLLHDLVGNLQGDVFLARQYLNHALFDLPEELRWTASFADKLDPARPPRLLLDHIMFTQGLTRSGAGPLAVAPKAGTVEHEVFERVSSLMPRRMELSDHRPVSVDVSRRP